MTSRSTHSASSTATRNRSAAARPLATFVLWMNDGELLAPVARRTLVGARGVAEDAGETAQDLVARRMPEGVVVLLEAGRRPAGPERRSCRHGGTPRRPSPARSSASAGSKGRSGRPWRPARAGGRWRPPGSPSRGSVAARHACAWSCPRSPPPRRRSDRLCRAGRSCGRRTRGSRQDPRRSTRTPPAPLVREGPGNGVPSRRPRPRGARPTPAARACRRPERRRRPRRPGSTHGRTRPRRR